MHFYVNPTRHLLSKYIVLIYACWVLGLMSFIIGRTQEVSNLSGFDLVLLVLSTCFWRRSWKLLVVAASMSYSVGSYPRNSAKLYSSIATTSDVHERWTFRVYCILFHTESWKLMCNSQVIKGTKKYTESVLALCRNIHMADEFNLHLFHGDEGAGSCYGTLEKKRIFSIRTMPWDRFERTMNKHYNFKKQQRDLPWRWRCVSNKTFFLSSGCCGKRKEHADIAHAIFLYQKQCKKLFVQNGWFFGQKAEFSFFRRKYKWILRSFI